VLVRVCPCLYRSDWQPHWQPDRRPAIQIKPYRNRGGSTSWRLSGTLPGGRRIRRNYPSRPEAEAALEDILRTLRGHDGRARHPRLTWLTADHLRDAELAAELLGPGVSVLEAARDYAARNQAIAPLPLLAAAREYTAERRAAGVRPRTLDNVEGTLRHWFAGIHARTTTEVTPRDVAAYVLSPTVAPRSRSDRRQILGQFCRWCVRRGAMASDWTERLPPIIVTKDLPRILNVPQAEALIAAARAAGPGLYAYALLGLYTGIRPTEARRIAPEDIHLDPDLSCITISPRAAKVRQARTIDLPPPLRAALAELPAPLVRYQRKPWEAVRRAAGLHGQWQLDIMRHTYASHHYALHRDAKALVYQMGNSEQVLFRSYIRPVPRAQADAYWRLLHTLPPTLSP
jgi:integrase